MAKRKRAKKVKLDDPIKCANNGCFRVRAEGRTICNTCKSRAYSKKNPIVMIWHWIKKSAKKRNLEFSITKQELTEFLAGTNYVAGRGRLRDQLTLDRKEGLIGYHIWNLQVLLKHQNCEKYHKGDNPVSLEENDVPF